MAFSRMCFGGNSKEDPDAQKNKEIEKQIREDQKKMAREIKLLLLGMSSDGSSVLWSTIDITV